MKEKKTEYYIFVFILLWCILFWCLMRYEFQKEILRERDLKPTFDSCADLFYDMK